MKWTYDFYFVDTTDFIEDPYLKGISRNLAEFWTYRFRDTHGVLKSEVLTHYDAPFGLAAVSDADFTIVAEPGCQFNTRGWFLENLDEVLTSDTFLMGHILDRGSRYYELHSQCYVFNNHRYRELPVRPGRISKNEIKPVIERSPDNFHDDYTPTWIKRGEGTADIDYPAVGSDLIAAGLNAGWDVLPFPESVRDSKLFLYPEKKSHDGFLNQLLTGSGTRPRHYPFSLESVPDLSDIKPLDYLACPCNGFNVFLYLVETGMNDGCTIELYDHNPLAINIFLRMFSSWNGGNCRDLFRGYDNMLRGRSYLDSHEKQWDEFIDLFGGMGEWLEFFKHVRNQDVHIRHADLMSMEQTDWKVRGNSLFVTSNIYDFAETAVHYNTQYRMRAYQKLLDSLPSDTWMHTIFPLRRHRHIVRARDENLDMTLKFPWAK